MMIKQIFTVAVLAMMSILTINANPKSEIRAVWLTTNGGMDWPKGIYTEAQQKAKLIEILDKLEDANFNTVLLQVQVKGDVLWDSDIQPAMYAFTGNGAKRLSWNVCDYVIEECHKRNMECHAWIVPYRIGTTSEASKYSSNPVKHVTVTNPEMCVLYSSAWYLDPGLPEVRTYLLILYRELITKHKFDGTNFDYTRYPGATFDDSKSYSKYGNGMDKDDWRRENINKFVHEFYDMAKSVNPDIKVGAAPIGTYKNVNGSGNMSAYENVYQDACEWMQAGKQDVLFPQMYWNEKYGFSTHMTTWVENSASRQLVVGLAPYKMVDSSNNWECSVVTDQIEKVRAKDGMHGVCFFRTDHVLGTEAKIKELYNELKDNYFKYPAHIVPMDYNGVTKPNKPVNASYEYKNGVYNLTWETPTLDEKGTAIKYYNVYADVVSTVDVNDISKCVGFAVKGTEFSYPSSADNKYFAITTMDKNYYESEANINVSAGIDEVLSQKCSVKVSNSELKISSSKSIEKVEIYTLSGALKSSVMVGNSMVTIPLSDYEKGIFIVKIKMEDFGIAVDKIIL